MLQYLLGWPKLNQIFSRPLNKPDTSCIPRGRLRSFIYLQTFKNRSSAPTCNMFLLVLPIRENPVQARGPNQSTESIDADG